MTLVALPNTRVRRLERRLVTAAAMTRSPFSGAEQVQAWGGAWWEYAFELGPFTDDDARSRDAILQALGGMSTAFTFADPSAANSASLGSPTVSGGSQTGTSLVTAGWTPSASILQAGQFFSLGADETLRLHMVTADATADGSGNATLSITPALRESPADAAALEYAAPAVQLRLVGTGIPASIEPGVFYTFSVEAREAL